MVKHTNLIFKHAQMRVEGDTIRCENHTVRLSDISQLWTGKGQGEELPNDLAIIIILVNMMGIHLFYGLPAALILACSTVLLVWRHVIQRREGLHMKMCSGDIYSFIPDNKYFLDQVYSLMNEIIMKKNASANYSIIFDGNGKIMDHSVVLPHKEKGMEEINVDEKIEKEELKEEKKTVQKAKASYGLNDQLISELQTLYTVYKENENADEGILSLIGQTTEKIIANDLKDIKEMYGKFIESGLINECNDLGLNVLIGEIKSRIFV